MEVGVLSEACLPEDRDPEGAQNQFSNFHFHSATVADPGAPVFIDKYLAVIDSDDAARTNPCHSGLAFSVPLIWLFLLHRFESVSPNRRRRRNRLCQVIHERTDLLLA